MSQSKRSRDWQKKMVAAGRCRTCGDLRDGDYAQHCNPCGRKERARRRELYHTHHPNAVYYDK